MKKIIIIALTILFGCVFSVSAYANSNNSSVIWANWTMSNVGNPGSADGTINRPGSNTILISYTGEVSFAQTSGEGTNYWDPSTPYVSSTIENPPPDSDIISLAGGDTTVNTIVFSEPVINPVMAIVSLGAPGNNATYQFNAPFEILSFGQGYWGDGQLVELSGNILQGEEGHGVIQFLGTFDSISWTAPSYENWHGFTIGIPSGSGTNGEGCTQAELDAKYQEGYNAAVQACKDDPASCGISVNGGGGTSTGDCATFNLFANTLHVPCLDVGGGNTYFLDLQ